MPKSRNKKAAYNRLRARLEKQVRKTQHMRYTAGLYEHILTLTEEALAGMGLEATYFDQPRPHVVISQRIAPDTATS